MSSKYEVIFTPEAREDLSGLDGATVRRIAKGLKRLATNPLEFGQPLGSRNGSNLTGLRKYALVNRSIRIIYEVVEGNRVVVLWVIAKRSDDECYRLASERIPEIGSPVHRALLERLLNSLRK